MNRTFRWALVAVAALSAAPVAAQSLSGTVGEVISARRGLMNQLNSLELLIEEELDAGRYNPELLYALGESVAASLEAFAVLLPENTNLQGGAPAVEGAETTAAPAVWDDLPAFQQWLRDTAAVAREAIQTTDLDSFTALWDPVRQSCESCHATSIAFDPFATF